MSDEEKEFYLSIVADRKPYFMQYIYSTLKKDYRDYVANTNRQALRMFCKDVDELFATPEDELSEQEKDFLKEYKLYCPVIDAKDTMNTICHKVEDEFRSYVTKHKSDEPFDYSIMKSDAWYSANVAKEIRKLYKEYTSKLMSFKKQQLKKRVEKYESNEQLKLMRDDFKRKCLEICSNEKILCNVVIDMLYKKESSKAFVWNICGEQIIRNLLHNNNNEFSVPVPDENGDVEFKGHRYRFEKVKYEEGEQDVYL